MSKLKASNPSNTNLTKEEQSELENRLQSKAIVFAWQKQSVPEGKEYSLLKAELKYRKDILCGAEGCALHL